MVKLSALLAASLTLVGCLATGAGDAPTRSGATAARCADMPGAAAILARSDKRYLIFGEMHGTAETPALFADFVCLAARDRPVVVGLELQSSQQPLLDRYMASDGSNAAQAELRATDHWSKNKDGRASIAMFGLVERLRALRAAGLQLRVVAFVPDARPDGGSQTPYEKAMAKIWSDSLIGDGQAKFMALVGNVHSMRRTFNGFEPAAMHMPAGSLLTFGFAPAGGEAWNCQQDGCAPHPIGPAIVSPPRGFSVPPAQARRFVDDDYWYSAGKPFTASAPLGSSRADR